MPGTVAVSLNHDIDAVGNYDADDWWYRLTFAVPALAPGARYRLRFDGLATLARVWLNGAEILASRNMFVAQRVDVTGLLREKNDLVIVFHSLLAALGEPRVRPRWKTALVEQQNLRWVRTTLLGRIPGWTPPIQPVGPWKPIALERVEHIELKSMDVQARARGTLGTLKLRAVVCVLDANVLESAQLRLGDACYRLDIEHGQDLTITGELAILDVPLWWPHTHGVPKLLACQLELRVNGVWLPVDCGRIGFKEIELDQDNGKVRFVINQTPVFCRGACWTPEDFLSLREDPAALARTLELARDAGVNMLRVIGTMVYESSTFYRLCDELGILVWQDFMFANMDYPVGDAEFRRDIEAEAAHQLDRLQRHVCVAAYCGGSEVAQQAAMLGLPAAEWTNDFFAGTLPRVCAQRHAGIPYFPSTPWGGALPFHVGTGISHYFGVGAYRRPLAEVKSARIKFTSECLGFSNVPDPQTTALVLHGTTPPPHHPRWKARQPRDSGVGWDFEDIRDHYLRALFDVDPVELRSRDVPRYYAVSRVVTGEVMQRAYSEWRNPGSECSGALVWFFRDFWPGAGWGIVDSTGTPKAALWFLKRAWATQAVRFTDEGLDGLQIHLFNENAEPLDARVELEMFQHGCVLTGGAHTAVLVPARGAITLQGDALLGYFSDSTEAYRFGPAKHDVITVRLRHAATGRLLSEDFYFPRGLSLPTQRNAKVTTRVDAPSGGRVIVSLRSDVFLQAVSVSCKGYTPDDNYFHLAPNQEKSIVFTAAEPTPARFRAHFEPLNLEETITVRTPAAGPDDARA